MPKKKTLKSLSLDKLYELRDSVDVFLFKHKETGEAFHPEYRKNKKIFNKLVYQSVRFKNELNTLFKEQAENAGRLVEMSKIKAADEDKDKWFNMEYWDIEDGKFAVVVDYYVSTFFELGASSAAAEFSFPVELDRASPEAKFISKYSLDLVKNVSETTRNRLRQQIQSGLTLGENREKIANRIDKIIRNPKRSVTIAQTESVRAYSEGRLALGHRLGAKGKKWATTYKPCAICSSLDQQVVKMNEEFKSPFNGKSYNGPPAHPHCRCLVKLIIDDPDADL